MVETPQRSAEVAELADASVSKTDVRKDVRVRLPVSAPRGCNGGGRVAGYGPRLPANAGFRCVSYTRVPAHAGNRGRPGGLRRGDDPWDHVRLDHGQDS